jgi:hypothetical protein
MNTPAPSDSLNATPVKTPLDAMTDAQIYATLRRPHRLAEVVLGRWQSVADRIWSDASPIPLMALLLITSAVPALAYGLVIDPTHAWSVAALYAGSVLLCYPALHVFGCYLGGARRASQDLTLALTLSAAAALFTFGFAPVVWFLKATLASGSGGIGISSISGLLLTVAFLAGLGQLARAVDRGPTSTGLQLLIAGWGLLVAGITWRMAHVLGLAP